MNILLIGEYSGVHTALAEGLALDGHNVVTVSNGDSYKSLPANLLVKRSRSKSRLRSIKYLSALLNFLGLTGVGTFLKYRSAFTKLPESDVVQLINPVAVPELGALGNMLLVGLLKKKGKKLFLSALGDDYSWVKACLTKRYSYSALDRLNFFSLASLAKHSYSLKYIASPLYLILDFYVRKNSVKIVPGLLDYALAYEGCTKRERTIPLPVPLKSFYPPTPTGERVRIFHAWQKGKEVRKGNDVLDAAVQRVIEFLGSDRIEYVVAQGLSYEQYINSYRDCDIYLDQVYSYDRGMAGALGMCAGKVVFSGFEGCQPAQTDSDRHVFGLTSIGVNATPDADQIFQCLVYLIDNKACIDRIKQRAYEYALANYKADSVAANYLDLWAKN